jgi:hypothetical protein
MLLHLSPVCAWAALPALLLLAACAGPAPTNTPPMSYVVPTSGATARLLVRASVPSGDRFGIYVHEDAVDCKRPRLAGSGNASSQPAATMLAAGQLATIDFVLFKPGKQQCVVRWSFTPEAGRSYVVSALGAAAGCNVRVLDATDPDAIKPAAQLLRRDRGPRRCVGIEEARATAAGAAVGTQLGDDAVLREGATGDDLGGLLPP